MPYLEVGNHLLLVFKSRQNSGKYFKYDKDARRYLKVKYIVSNGPGKEDTLINGKMCENSDFKDSPEL